MSEQTEYDQPTESAFTPLGKDEMNFAEHPIALLTDRAPKGQRSIKFEDEVYDERKKKLVPRRRLIEGSEEYGLPTATDDMVILGLIQLTKQSNDFTHREVEFSRHELIRILNWPNEGKSYDRIKSSLMRIKGVNYFYDNAWWDSRLKAWTTRAFSIIDNVEINDSRTSDGQGGLFPSRIVWNEIVFDSLKSGFVRDLDFQLCMRLEHAIAVRMYRFLGKRFYVKADWTFDLKEFADLYLNLGRNYEGGKQISRKLQPAICELESVGFLEPMSEAERFPRNGRNWSIRFVKKLVTPTPAIESTPPGEVQDSGIRESLTRALSDRGVSDKIAAELAAKYPPEFMQGKIEQFDWEMKQPKPPKKPAGYLVRSIHDDYKANKDFVPLAELKKQNEAKRQRQVAEAEANRRKQQVEIQAKAEKALIFGYFKGLSEPEQAAHDAAAIAQADAEQLELIKPGPMKSMGMGLIRDSYTRKLLEAQGKLPLTAV